MNAFLAAHAPLAANLNAPGGYLNWSIFTISEANLVLVAVMVAIFGIALLAPFPGRRHGGSGARRRAGIRRRAGGQWYARPGRCGGNGR